MDGTFKVSPDMYYQLSQFTCRLQVLVFCVCLYVFLTKVNQPMGGEKRKKEKKVLFGTKNLVQDPQTVRSDFEKASINGLRSVFSQTDHTGCFFSPHFCQTLHKKIVNLDFKNPYQTESRFS